MGEEVLLRGELNVFRSDRKELKKIRNGAWAYDDLVAWADEQVDYLYDLVREGKAVVPKSPDYNAIEGLAIEAQERAWRRLAAS